MGWDNKERLICVAENGQAFVYNVFGEFLSQEKIMPLDVSVYLFTNTTGCECLLVYQHHRMIVYLLTDKLDVFTYLSAPAIGCAFMFINNIR